jgi:hypothetical protein
MLTRPRPTRVRPVALMSESAGKRSSRSNFAGRLIQVILAVYLIPALMIVLIVGGIGMLVLSVSRYFSGPIRRAAG